MNLAGAWNCSNFVYLDSFGAIRVTAFNIHINFAHAVICMRNSAVLLVINCCLLTAFTRALSDEQSANFRKNKLLQPDRSIFSIKILHGIVVDARKRFFSSEKRSIGYHLLFLFTLDYCKSMLAKELFF